MNHEGQELDREAYINACAVIQDYCRSGGERVEGGTGL